MELQEYINAKQGKKPNADIVQRWESRVIPQGLHTQGKAGAQQYLNLYGKGIAAPKCILLAIQAQNSGYPDMALGFWQKAYELETGSTNFGDAKAGGAASANVPLARPNNGWLSEHFPPSLQPGKLVTMQPEDAMHPRAQYLEREEYWGQPKRDGNKVVIFAAPDGVWYQSRSMKLRADPDMAMTRVLKVYAEQRRDGYILEGELYYLDHAGKEHRTGAQAAKVNIEAGKGNTPVLTRYMPFYAIYNGFRDLRDTTHAIRVLEGNTIAHDLAEMSPIFVVPEIARTFEEKSEMANLQFIEGREGEVWTRANALYHAGKDKSEDVVRTKYLVEKNALVTGLTPTTAQGRLFGAIQIADPETGQPWGTIGTGFDHDDQVKIGSMHKASPGRVIIPIVCQGFTEDGLVWLGRLSEEFKEQFS